MPGSWVGALCSWCHFPLEVGENLSATRRCGSTTSANPSDGRSGHRAPPAPRQHQGNQHGKTKEERREGGSTPERQARRPSRGSWNVTPAAWNCGLPVPLAEHNRQILQGGGKVVPQHCQRGSCTALLTGSPCEAVAPVRVYFQTRWALTSLGLLDLSGPLTSLGLSGLFRL